MFTKNISLVYSSEGDKVKGIPRVLKFQRRLVLAAAMVDGKIAMQKKWQNDKTILTNT